MFVEFKCASCGKLLRVPSSSAGGKAECPACGSISDVVGPPSPTADQGDIWKVRTPEGNVYGPVTKTELDRWLSDGRITADCHILPGSAEQWQPAGKVYPSLGSAPAGSSASFPPRADGPAEVNPYGSPAAQADSSYGPGRYTRPHRGAMILVFGLLGIVLCPCFAPFAWIMGRNDLDAMNAGVMDREGYSLTQAGWICGIIGTAIILLQIAGAGLAIIVMIAAEA